MKLFVGFGHTYSVWLAFAGIRIILYSIKTLIITKFVDLQVSVFLKLRGME